MENHPHQSDSSRHSRGLALSLCLAACAPAVQVHGSGAAQHERASVLEEQAAAEHEKQYLPDAIKAACSSQGERNAGVVCWASASNPTQQHLREAERHRALAAAHRAASSALRAAEASACGGVAPPDRDMSPFAHREDIVRAEPLLAPSGSKSLPRQVGVTVFFRAVPGLTSEWLQRLIDCHVARNALLGHDAPEMAYCPLAVRGVTAHVSAEHGGYAVALRADEQESINAIRERVDVLVRPQR